MAENWDTPLPLSQATFESLSEDVYAVLNDWLIANAPAEVSALLESFVALQSFRVAPPKASENQELLDVVSSLIAALSSLAKREGTHA